MGATYQFADEVADEVADEATDQFAVKLPNEAPDLQNKRFR